MVVAKDTKWSVLPVMDLGQLQNLCGKKNGRKIIVGGTTHPALVAKSVRHIFLTGLVLIVMIEMIRLVIVIKILATFPTVFVISPKLDN